MPHRCLFLFALTIFGCSDGPGDPNHRDSGGVDTGASSFCEDADGDTICDVDEGTHDNDGDGTPNDHDLDSDGDGVSDREEAGDGDPSTPPLDSNGDGLPDSLDPTTPVRGMDAGIPMLRDGGGLYEPDGEAGMIVEALCMPSDIIPTGCLTAIADESAAGLCNELDDDCDGLVDERCVCEPGAVQPCFRGPPGRRNVGGCADGTQRCVSSGEFGGEWGACTSGIAPRTEVCDGLDNDCNGCTDEVEGCIPVGECPGPGDPRVRDGAPFSDYPLRGRDFFAGSAATWRWTVEGGPCETILPRRSYTVSGANSETATFHPTLSGDYTVTMTVTTTSGETFTCTWIVHVVGPGLRVEMCYPESETLDLDLFLSQPGYTGNWYIDTNDAFQPAQEVCGWHDCEAMIRGTLPTGPLYPRANWGYATSPTSECDGGPQGPQWVALGFCGNPRLDIDNNLSEGIGVPENINVDAPREGEEFRIMIQNFTGTISRQPVVNVYCGGRRVATYGVAPDEVPAFNGVSGFVGIGAMWRVADVTTHVVAGETTCDVAPIHPPGETTGYDVTYDNARF